METVQRSFFGQIPFFTERAMYAFVSIIGFTLLAIGPASLASSMGASVADFWPLIIGGAIVGIIYHGSSFYTCLNLKSTESWAFNKGIIRAILFAGFFGTLFLSLIVWYIY